MKAYIDLPVSVTKSTRFRREIHHVKGLTKISELTVETATSFQEAKNLLVARMSLIVTFEGATWSSGCEVDSRRYCEIIKIEFLPIGPLKLTSKVHGVLKFSMKTYCVLYNKIFTWCVVLNHALYKHLPSEIERLFAVLITYPEYCSRITNLLLNQENYNKTNTLLALTGRNRSQHQNTVVNPTWKLKSG